MCLLRQKAATRATSRHTKNRKTNSTKPMDNNKNNPNGQQMQLEIKPEVALGNYSNFAVISHSSSEFTIDFATILPGMPKANVGTRVVMAPEHVIRLLHALQDNVSRYESQFGKINIPGIHNKTIAPFKTGGNGEA